MNESAGAVISERHTEFDRRAGVSRLARRSGRRSSRSLRSPRPLRRPSMVPLFLSAVLSLTAVAVADRAEQRLVAPTVTPATASLDADARGDCLRSRQRISQPDPAHLRRAPRRRDGPHVHRWVRRDLHRSRTIRSSNSAPPRSATSTCPASSRCSPRATPRSPRTGATSPSGIAAAGDGIEHGYTVDEPVSAGDDLTVTIDVVDGEPTLVDSQNVAIERAEGGIVWYRGVFAFDARGADLQAEMAVVDGDIELRVDTAGAEYPITIDPTISELQKLVTLTDAAGDRFGESVAIDGVPGDMTIVVGAVGADGEQGAAYVFRNEGSFSGILWVQVAKLLPPTPGDRQFGWDVDVRGDVVVVGAPGDDANGRRRGRGLCVRTSRPIRAVAADLGRLPVRPVGRQPLWRHRRGHRLRRRRLRVLRRPDRPVPPGRCTGFPELGRRSVGVPALGQRLADQHRRCPRSHGHRAGSTVPRLPVTNSGTPSPERTPARTSSWALPVTTTSSASTPVGPSTSSGTARPCLLRSCLTSRHTNPTATPGPLSKWNSTRRVTRGCSAGSQSTPGSRTVPSRATRTRGGTCFLRSAPQTQGCFSATERFAIYPGAARRSRGTHVLHGDHLADGSASDAGRALYRPVLPDEDPAYNQLGSGLGVLASGECRRQVGLRRRCHRRHVRHRRSGQRRSGHRCR